MTIQANDINVSTTIDSTTIDLTTIDSTIIGSMNMNVVAESSAESWTSWTKKRMTNEPTDSSDDDLFSPRPTKRHNPLQEFSKDHPEDDLVIHEKVSNMQMVE